MKTTLTIAILLSEGYEFNVALGLMSKSEFAQLKRYNELAAKQEDAGEKIPFVAWLNINKLMRSFDARLPWGHMERVKFDENSPYWNLASKQYKAECEFAEIEDYTEGTIFICEYYLERLGKERGELVIWD